MGRTSDARRRLIEAAHDLIWEHSYGAVTIDAICERASVKKGSFYYFFDSKSDLALTAIDQWWAERQKIMDDFFQPTRPPLDRIRAYLDFLACRQLHAYETTGHMLGCPLFTLGSEICTQDEAMRLRIQELLTRMFQYLEVAVADARAAREIKTDDPTLTARHLVCFYEGALTRARIENDPAQMHSLTDDCLRMIGARPACVLT